MMSASFIQRRAFSASARNLSKVAVLGAAGGIGQPLSLLMKLNPRVTELALYDIRGAPGVAADISHVNTKSTVKGYEPNATGLAECLKGAEIVLIPAGVPRKPGMTRDDLFNTNAGIIRDLTQQAAKACPKAHICIITNPVNSTVPIAAEILKKAGTYDPARLFGVTTLDIVRAKTFVAGARNLNPFDISVNVVGGHSGLTIVPLLSQTGLNFTEEETKALTKRIQYGGDEVVNAKDGAGSATLSMAYAGANFADAVMSSLSGDAQTVCTFVESDVTEAPFFASKVTLGKDGVDTIHGLGEITPYEEQLVADMLPDLVAQAAKGVAFANQ